MFNNNAFMANLRRWQKIKRTYVRTSSRTVPDAALEQRNVHLLMDVFRCTMWINGP